MNFKCPIYTIKLAVVWTNTKYHQYINVNMRNDYIIKEQKGTN